MTSRQLRLLVLTTSAFGLIFFAVVCLLVDYKYPICWSNWQRITKAMTENEVEKILGGPPTHYHFPHRTVFWRSNMAQIDVEYNANGEVESTSFIEFSSGVPWYERLLYYFREGLAFFQ
jgi:hypothetical protein